MDLIFNHDAREAYLVDATLPRRWQTRPGKLPTILCRDPLKRANGTVPYWLAPCKGSPPNTLVITCNGGGWWATGLAQ